ncbi:MAG TPA: Fic family protein [Thermoanaerobaculia bacterium]|nr:Fic family protein [Thermoanaerobaculia bacterium]
MRTYERTHPWLKFQLDLRQASPELWLLLGEAQSKCEHIAGVPLRPDTAARLHRLYLAKGALATTAIEGNTLTEDEALQLVEKRLELPKSREYLARELRNVVDACNQITDELDGSTGELSVEQILAFNRAVLDNLPLEPHVVPGRIRDYSVGVGKYPGAPHEDCRYLLEHMCSWLNEPPFRGSEENRIALATLRAVLAHLYVAWIHPFGDGNGRTARLIEFYILLSAGVPSPAAHLLSNHYNQTRAEYYRQLQAASDSGGNPLPFVSYATQGFVDGLRDQLREIRTQQWDVAWRNYVDEEFRDEKTGAPIRQRDLVLDLSVKEGWIAVADIPTLTPRLASSYAGKGSKTVTRDLNALAARGLIDRVASRVRARKGIILAFLPPRRVTEIRELDAQERPAD